MESGRALRYAGAEVSRLCRQGRDEPSHTVREDEATPQLSEGLRGKETRRDHHLSDPHVRSEASEVRRRAAPVANGGWRADAGRRSRAAARATGSSGVDPQIPGRAAVAD